MLNYGVFIGRFQPLHNGHIAVINEALRQVKHLIILVGSSNMARSPKNPFTYQERALLIHDAIIDGTIKKTSDQTVSFRPLPDSPYNDAKWIANTVGTVNDLILSDMNRGTNVTLHGLDDAGPVGIIGFEKDHSSFYLKMFPQWTPIEIKTQWAILSATDVRNDYFRRSSIIASDHLLPATTMAFLKAFMVRPEFKWLVEEQEYYHVYKRSWRNAPFPPTIVCTDAVVVQGSRILLIERKGHPGKGLLALPGGHVNQDEFLVDCVVRELIEETAIADKHGEVPKGVLKSWIKRTREFDDPNRSQRGRVITHAYRIELPPRDHLFTVRGGDDAAAAKFYEIPSLRQTQFYEDHAFIIEEMTGVELS